MGKQPAASADLIKSLVQLAQITDKQAKRLLNETDWNLERALNLHFDQAKTDSGSSEQERQLRELFDHYANLSSLSSPPSSGGTSGGILGVEGFEQFCKDLDIDPSGDIVTLLISHWCSCKQMCQFEWAGWRNCFHLEMNGCHSMSMIKAKLHWVRSRLDQDDSLFATVYQYAFRLALDEQQKSLPCEMAIGLWQVMFTASELPRRRFQYLNEWLEFVQQHYGRAISKDTWNMFLEFVRLRDFMTEYNEDDAWPTLIDDFVSHMKQLPRH